MPSEGQNDFTGGMVDRLAPDAIPVNTYAYGENVEIRDGFPRTRRGSYLLYPQTNTWPRAACIFDQKTDTISNEILFMVDSEPYPQIKRAFLPGNFEYVPLPTALCNDDITFIQAFGHLYVTRGEGKLPLYWSGASTDNFSYVPTPIVGERFPSCSFALFAYNRIWAATGTTVMASDLLEDSFDSVGQSWDISSGDENGPITAIIPYSDSGLLVFKRSSTWLLNGCNGDLSGLTLTPIDLTHGCVGRRALTQVGSDVWYLSDDGIRSIELTTQAKAQAVNVAVSNNIRAFTSRINYREATKVCAITYDNYVLFSVPVNGNTNDSLLALNGLVNNTILAYDTSLQTWVGPWTGTPTGQFLYWAGQNALISIDSGKPGSILRLLDEDYQDLISSRQAITGDVTANLLAPFAAAANPKQFLFEYVLYGTTGNSVVFDHQINPRAMTCALGTSIHPSTGRLIGRVTLLYSQDGVKWACYADFEATHRQGNICIIHNGVQAFVFVNGIAATMTYISTTDKTAWFTDSVSPATTSLWYGSSVSSIKRVMSFDANGLPLVDIPFRTTSTVLPFALVGTVRATGTDYAASVTAGTLSTDTAGVDIPTSLKTREYLIGQPLSAKRFSAGEVTVLGRNPNFSVTALSRGGLEQVALLTNKQYSSTESDFYDGTVWNGDETTFNAEGRSNMAPVILPGGGIVLQTLGIPLDREVEHTDSFWNGKVDAGTQLQVTNTQGTLAVKSVSLSASSQGSSLRRNR